MRVQDLMSPAPVTISLRESIAKARGLMRTHDVRHLPVTENGRLVGLVSERDVYLLQSQGEMESVHQPISEAMTEYPYTVHPNDPMSTVALELANHKYGCAVVVEGERVVGIVTTVDALRALASTLKP